MYIRKLRNRSGSVSVQVIQKVRGRYKVVKTIGCATEQHMIEQLESQARGVIEELSCQRQLFGFDTDQAVEDAFSALANVSIRTVSPELIFGRIYDKIGFGTVGEPLFRHLAHACRFAGIASREARVSRKTGQLSLSGKYCLIFFSYDYLQHVFYFAAKVLVIIYSSKFIIIL